MARFKTLSAREFDLKLKARIQSTGKLGFGEETIAILRLDENTYIIFCLDEESDDTLLYMSITRQPNKDAFQVKRAGKYCYLTTARMFDSLDIDYKNKTAIFDLVRMTTLDEELGGEVYKMQLRYTNKKQNEDEGGTSESADEEADE